MKALTVWQPWATLIADGVKPFEFRGHKRCVSIIGQRIAIHAAARKVDWREVNRLIDILESGHWRMTGLQPYAATVLKWMRDNPDAITYSHVVCTAVLGVPTKNPLIDGVPLRNDSTRSDQANWGWPLHDVEKLIPPIPARGAQGFWNWSA